MFARPGTSYSGPYSSRGALLLLADDGAVAPPRRRTERRAAPPGGFGNPERAETGGQGGATAEPRTGDAYTVHAGDPDRPVCGSGSRVRTSARRAASRRLVVKPASGVSRSGHTAQRARLRTHTGALFRQRLRVSALPLCGSASASARVRSGLAKAVTACNGVSWIFLASSAEHGGHAMLGPQYAVSARASLAYAPRVPGVCAEST